MWSLKITREAKEDLKRLKTAGLLSKVNSLISILKENPFAPTYEKLGGDLKGHYSRRITLKHRLVYRIDKDNKTVIIVMMWSHYGD